MIIHHRSRRFRNSPSIRDLFSETSLSPKDFIQPLFVIEGRNKKQKIDDLHNNYKLSIDNLVKKTKELYSLGIRCIMLFPSIDESLKNNYAPESINPDNLICRAIKEIKNKVPEMVVAADVALDPYTQNGHDGVLNQAGTDVENDATVSILARQAKTLAVAGADIVCPSDMMDGKVQVLRETLEESGFINTKIASYAVKYASALYGPFRKALNVSQLEGPKDKKTYQMDYRNTNESMVKIETDIGEGCDIIIIKPANFYLDIIKSASEIFYSPIWAYQVSGEYQMICSMPNYEDVLLESCIAIKRAGARNIISYGAENICKKL